MCRVGDVPDDGLRSEVVRFVVGREFPEKTGFGKFAPPITKELTWSGRGMLAATK